MNKFDMQSAKFVGIIIGICLIFVFVIWHAFSYLPESDKTNKTQNEVIVPSDEDENSDDDSEEVSQEQEESSEELKEDEYKEPNYKTAERKKDDVKPADEDKLEPLEPIEEDETKNSADKEQEDNILEDVLNKAKEFRLNHKPISAISEYQRAISMTADVSIKAQCYENIALIYASARRYGSALAAAQKAYNTSPTVSREMLLARLYYKTGDTEKANIRVNNILRKEFTIE